MQRFLILLLGWLFGRANRETLAARVESVKQEARADRAEAELTAEREEKPQEALARRFGRGPVIKIAAVLALGLSACSPAPAPPTDTFCQLAKVITIDPAHDRLSDQTARAILAHDILVEKRCGKI